MLTLDSLDHASLGRVLAVLELEGREDTQVASVFAEWAGLLTELRSPSLPDPLALAGPVGR